MKKMMILFIFFISLIFLFSCAGGSYKLIMGNLSAHDQSITGN